MRGLIVLVALSTLGGACSAPRSVPRPRGDDAGVGADIEAGSEPFADTGVSPAAEAGAMLPRDAAPGAELGAPLPDGSSPDAAQDLSPAVKEAGSPSPDAPPDAPMASMEAGVPLDTGPNPVANGMPCSSGTACASTFCVDGVCCESSCGGQCEACAQSGTAGQCVAVTGPPAGTRTACSGSGTCGASCNGSNRQSCSYPASDKECAAASCTAGTAYSRSVCDGKGACQPQTTGTCGPGGCAGTICMDGCSASNPCPAGEFCNASKCFPKQALGAACTSADACASGKCVDGVCCNSNCDGACESCSGGGTCAPVKSADDDKCVGKTCDGTGACKARAGSDCGGAGVCASGNCVDAKCCTASSCGACQACTGGGGICVAVVNKDDDACPGTCDATGACKSKQGQACGAGCVAGTTCVDGYCCDQACTSPCMACNQAGKLGTCSPVSGAPVGTRSCGSGACAGMCTGAVGGVCSYSGGNCGPGPVCSAGTFTGQGTCSFGSCMTPAPQSCPIGCDATGCKTATCTSPSGSNLVANPGFDMNLAGWTLVASGGTVSRSTTDYENCPTSGTARLAVPSPSSSMPRLEQCLSLPPGLATYYFNIKLRSVGLSVVCEVREITSGGCSNPVYTLLTSIYSSGETWGPTGASKAFQAHTYAPNIQIMCAVEGSESSGGFTDVDFVYVGTSPATF